MKLRHRIWPRLALAATLLLASSIVIVAAPVAAADYNWDYFTSGFMNVKDIAGQNKINADRTVLQIIRDIILVALGFVGIIAVAVLVYGGFTYITALGDESKASTAKKIIFYALVGLVVIGAAGIVVNLVVNQIIKGN